MPKVVDYPHASFKSVFEIAAAVDYLGGSCSVESCAERMQKKVSGAFKALISAAIKHGLLTNKKDVLSVTELYRHHKLGYNEQEKLEVLRQSFLMPSLYSKIYSRFKGKELPISMLDKLLIRELNVEETYASRVSGYFVDGAKTVKLLENGKLLDEINFGSTIDNVEVAAENREDESGKLEGIDTKPPELPIEAVALPISNKDLFTVMIVGPGMNTKIEINEEDDLVILDAMIRKIKKKLKEGSE
jgi:hypothetical protein